MSKPSFLRGRNARRHRSPTLGDVAASAGVSVSTAARVLRDQGWPVEPRLRERVLAAAAELSYVPNVMARTLRAGAPALIGLVTGNMLDPYYGEIAEAVTRYAEATSKMLVMVCNMQRDPQLELDYCRRLWEHRVAGLILSAGGFDQFLLSVRLAELIARMERSGVGVSTLTPRKIDIPTFSVDNEEVGRMAADAMLAHGHREIGIIVGPIVNIVLQQRIQGIAARCEAAGVRPHLVETDALGLPWILPAVADLFRKRPQTTGLIAASGTTSINGVYAVTATGRSVPHDVSVVGVGGGALDQWNTPRLTRIDLALEECGRAALDYMAARVQGSHARPPCIARPRIVEGASLARVCRAV